MDPKNLGVSCGQRILHKNQIVKYADLCIKWLYHSPSIITSKVFQLFIGIVPLVKSSHAITVGLLSGKSYTWLLRFFSEIIDCIISLLVLELEVKVIFLLGKSRPDGLRFEIGSWRNCVWSWSSWRIALLLSPSVMAMVSPHLWGRRWSKRRRVRTDGILSSFLLSFSYTQLGYTMMSSLILKPISLLSFIGNDLY